MACTTQHGVFKNLNKICVLRKSSTNFILYSNYKVIIPIQAIEVQ